jgi:hypothetical protein
MRHIVTTEETQYAIPNADGTLIYGTCPAGCNISTGQPVCETSIDGATYYDLISAEAVPWVAGMSIGTLPVAYNNEIYQPLQQHTAQADWMPDVVPALFRLIGKPTPSGYPEWVQPTGAHDAYQIGDRVMFKGAVYESKINANTWSPAVYPAGWRLI